MNSKKNKWYGVSTNYLHASLQRYLTLNDHQQTILDATPLGRGQTETESGAGCDETGRRNVYGAGRETPSNG